jgi:hypothetical protein
MTDTNDDLHAYAREIALGLRDPDRKQLRFNEIVECAKLFYAGHERAGVRELVEACDRSNAALYVPKRPMWHILNTEYRWMLPT